MVVDLPPWINGTNFLLLKLIKAPIPFKPKNLWEAKVKKSTPL